MAQKFVLTAQLDLQSPKNVPQVVRQIKSQLKGMDVDLKVKASPREMAQTSKQLSSIDKEGKKAAASTHALGKTLGAAARRFAAFSVATGTFLALARAIRGGTTEAIEFERELIRISQVTGKSTNQLKGLTREVTNLATSLGASSSQLLNAARTLSQAGFAADKAQKALKILAQTDLAATFNSINDTTEGSIALLRQFANEARAAGGEIAFLEQSLDAINAVSKKFAVESADLITVIRRTGGVFEAAGGKLNELIALFTSVRATTRESAETIAVGFRTIFTRIQRSETIDQLKELGIVLQDAKGQFVGPLEAINRLAVGLSSLDPRDYRFNEIVESLGGFRQIGKVIPLIKQFTTAQDALNVAQGASGSVAKDALTAQQALGVQIQKLREEFAGLMRDFIDTSSFRTMAKAFFGFAESLMKIADALKPLLPMLITLAAIKIGRGLAPSLAGFTGMKKGIGTTTRAQGGIIRMATGGMVPGSGDRDTVPAMLTPGEFVIKKSSVRKMGSSQLKAMNENRYKHGGIHLSPTSLGGKTSGMKSRTLDEPQQRGPFKRSMQVGGAFLREDKAAPLKRRLTTTLSKADFAGKEGRAPSTGGKAFGKGRTGKISNILGGGKLTIEVLSGKIPNKVAKNYEKELRQVVAGPAKRVISKYTGTGFSKEGFNKALNLANWEQTSGNLFEAAIAGSNPPFDNKRTQANAPFDYPSGLGDIGRKLGIPGGIPTDAKRTFGTDSLGSIVKKARNTILDRADQAGRKSAIKDVRKTGKTVSGPDLQAMFGVGTVRDAEAAAERGGYAITGSGGKYKIAKRKAQGGSISGSDTVPALLTPGEFVVNKASAQRIGYGNLGRMNRQGYAAGGVVATGRHAYGPPSAKSMGIGEMTWGGADPIKAGIYEIEASLNKLGITGEHFTLVATKAREEMEKGATAGEAWNVGIKEMTDNIAKNEKEVRKATKKGGAGDVAAADFEKFGDVGMVAKGTASAAMGGDVKATQMLAEIQQKEVIAITKKIRASDASIPIMEAKKKAEGVVATRYGALAKDLKASQKGISKLDKAREKAAKQLGRSKVVATRGVRAQQAGEGISRAGGAMNQVAFMGSAAALTAIQFAGLDEATEKAATQTVAFMGALVAAGGSMAQIFGPMIAAAGKFVIGMTTGAAVKTAETAASLASAGADVVETAGSGASAVADTVEGAASGVAATADVAEAVATSAATAALGPIAIVAILITGAFVAVAAVVLSVVGYFAFLSLKSKALADTQGKVNDEMLGHLSEGKGSIADFVAGVEAQNQHMKESGKQGRTAVKTAVTYSIGPLLKGVDMLRATWAKLTGSSKKVVSIFDWVVQKIGGWFGIEPELTPAAEKQVQMELKKSATALAQMTKSVYDTKTALKEIADDESLTPQQKAESIATVAKEQRATDTANQRAAQGRLEAQGIFGPQGKEQITAIKKRGQGKSAAEMQVIEMDLKTVSQGLINFAQGEKAATQAMRELATVEFEEKTMSELLKDPASSFARALQASEQAIIANARVQAADAPAKERGAIWAKTRETLRKNRAALQKQSAASKTLRTRTLALNLMFAKQRQSMHRALNVIDRFDDLARGLARVEKSFNNLSAIIDGTSQDFSAIPIKGLDDLGKVGNIRNFNKDIDRLTAGMGPAGQEIGKEVKKTAEIMRRGRGIIGQKRGIVGKSGQVVEAGKILKDLGITEADVGTELFGVLKEGIMEALKSGGMIDPAEFEKIFAPLIAASKHNVDALKKMQEVQNTYVKMYAANVDLLMQTMNKERELRAGMVDIERRGAERMAQARGGSLSGRANELFRTRRAQENLRGIREGGTGRQLKAGDVSGAAKTLQKAEKERQRIRSQLNNADFAQKKKLIEQDKLAASAANKARAELERLADQSARAADVLGEIEKLRGAREAKMGLLEKFVVGGKDERQEIAKSFAGLQRAMSTGTLQSMPIEFRKLTVGLLDQFKDVRIPGAGGLTGQQVKQRLVLGDAVRMGLVSAEMAQGLVTGLPEEQRLLTELGNINKQELEAQKALLENAKGHTNFARMTARNTGAILGQLKTTGGPAGGAVPATTLAGGGLVYRAAGGSIFQPRGTDTVPAMLTPGEFVIKKSSVDQVGTGFLHSINSGPGTVYRKFGGGIPRGGPDFTGLEGSVNIGSAGSARQMMGERLKKLGVHKFKMFSRQAGFTKSMVARTMKVISEGRYDFMNNVSAKVVADTTDWLGSWKHLFSVADSKRVGFKNDAGDGVIKLIAGLGKHSILSEKVGGSAAYRKASFKLAGLVAPQYLSQVKSIREAAAVWFAKREVTRRRRAGRYVPDNMLASAGLNRVRDIEEIEGVGAKAAKRAVTGMGGGFKRVPRRDSRGNIYRIAGVIQYRVVPRFGQATQQLFGVDQDDMGIDWQKKAKKERRVSVAAFARGGSVDSVPAMLTPGEFVMSRGAVQKHGVGFMSQLNRGNVQGFNKGGAVYAQGGRHMRFESGGSGGRIIERTKGGWPTSKRLDPAGELGLYKHWEHLSYAGYRERVERARKVAGLEARGYRTHVTDTGEVKPQFDNPLGPAAIRGTIGQNIVPMSALFLQPTRIEKTRSFRQAALKEPIPQNARREMVRQKDKEDTERRKRETADRRKEKSLLPLTKRMRDEYKKARNEDWPNLRREVGSAGVHATKDGYIWIWKNRKKTLQKAMGEIKYKNRFRSEGMPSFTEQRQDRKKVGTYRQEIAYMDQLLKGSSKTEEAEAAKKTEATIQGNWEKIGRVKSAVLGVVQTAKEVQKKEKANKEAQKIAEEQEKTRKEELSKVDELAGYWTQYLRNTPWRPMRLGTGSPAAMKTVPGTAYTYTATANRVRQRQVRSGDALPFSPEETLGVPIAASNQGINALGGMYKDMDRVMKQAERDKWIKKFRDARKNSRTTRLTDIQVERRRAKRARDFAAKADKLDVEDRPIAPIITPEEMSQANSLSGLGPNAKAAALEEIRQEAEADRKQRDAEREADKRFKNLENLRRRQRPTGRRGARTFAQGGPVYLQSGGMFQPRGADTVPAMLTPGEFVMRKSAVDQVGTGVLSAINAGRFADGGLVNYLSHGGDPRFEGYHDLTPETMTQVKKFFEHARGRAVTPGLDDLAREGTRFDKGAAMRAGQTSREGVKSYIDSGAPLVLPPSLVKNFVGEGMSVKDQLILMGLPHDDKDVESTTPDVLKNIRGIQEFQASPEQVAKREAERKRIAKGPQIGQRYTTIKGVDYAAPNFMDHMAKIGQHFWEHAPWGDKYLDTSLGRTGQKWLWEPGGDALEWIGAGFEGIGATGQSVVSAAAAAASLTGRALNRVGFRGIDLGSTLGKSPEEFWEDAKRQWHIADDVLKGFITVNPELYGEGLEKRAEQGAYGPDGLGSGLEKNVRRYWDIVLGGTALYRHGARKMSKLKDIQKTGQASGWWQANKVYKQQLFGEKLTKDMINEGAMIQRSLRSAQQPTFSEIITKKFGAAKARFMRPKTTQQPPKRLPVPDDPNKIASLQSQIESERLTLSDFSNQTTKLSEGDIIAQKAAKDRIALLNQQMDAAHIKEGREVIKRRSVGAQYAPEPGNPDLIRESMENTQREINALTKNNPKYKARKLSPEQQNKLYALEARLQDQQAQFSVSQGDDLTKALAKFDAEIAAEKEAAFAQEVVRTVSEPGPKPKPKPLEAATVEVTVQAPPVVAEVAKKKAAWLKGRPSQESVTKQIRHDIKKTKKVDPALAEGQEKLRKMKASQSTIPTKTEQAGIAKQQKDVDRLVELETKEARAARRKDLQSKLTKEGGAKVGEVQEKTRRWVKRGVKEGHLNKEQGKNIAGRRTAEGLAGPIDEEALKAATPTRETVTAEQRAAAQSRETARKVAAQKPITAKANQVALEQLEERRIQLIDKEDRRMLDVSRRDIAAIKRKKQNAIAKQDRAQERQRAKAEQALIEESMVPPEEGTLLKRPDPRHKPGTPGGPSSVAEQMKSAEKTAAGGPRRAAEKLKQFQAHTDPLDVAYIDAPKGDQIDKFLNKWGKNWKQKSGTAAGELGQIPLAPGAVMTREMTPIEKVARLERKLQQAEGELVGIEELYKVGGQEGITTKNMLVTGRTKEERQALKAMVSKKQAQIESLKQQQVKALEKVPDSTGMGPGYGGGGALRDEAAALRSQIDSTSDAAEIARLERDYTNLMLSREAHARGIGPHTGLPLPDVKGDWSRSRDYLWPDHPTKSVVAPPVIPIEAPPIAEPITTFTKAESKAATWRTAQAEFMKRFKALKRPKSSEENKIWQAVRAEGERGLFGHPFGKFKDESLIMTEHPDIIRAREINKLTAGDAPVGVFGEAAETLKPTTPGDPSAWRWTQKTKYPTYTTKVILTTPEMKPAQSYENIISGTRKPSEPEFANVEIFDRTPLSTRGGRKPKPKKREASEFHTAFRIRWLEGQAKEAANRQRVKDFWELPTEEQIKKMFPGIDLDTPTRGTTLGMATGGVIYKAAGGSIFQPRGTDTVPAMLTPGEFVIRKSAVDQVGTGVLGAINSGHFADGGLVSYLQEGGLEMGWPKEEPFTGTARDVMQQSIEKWKKSQGMISSKEGELASEKFTEAMRTIPGGWGNSWPWLGGDMEVKSWKTPPQIDKKEEFRKMRMGEHPYRGPGPFKWPERGPLLPSKEEAMWGLKDAPTRFMNLGVPGMPPVKDPDQPLPQTQLLQKGKRIPMKNIQGYPSFFPDTGISISGENDLNYAAENVPPSLRGKFYGSPTGWDAAWIKQNEKTTGYVQSYVQGNWDDLRSINPENWDFLDRFAETSLQDEWKMQSPQLSPLRELTVAGIPQFVVPPEGPLGTLGPNFSEEDFRFWVDDVLQRAHEGKIVSGATSLETAAQGLGGTSWKATKEKGIKGIRGWEVPQNLKSVIDDRTDEEEFKATMEKTFGPGWPRGGMGGFPGGDLLPLPKGLPENMEEEMKKAGGGLVSYLQRGGKGVSIFSNIKQQHRTPEEIEKINKEIRAQNKAMGYGAGAGAAKKRDPALIAGGKSLGQGFMDLLDVGENVSSAFWNEGAAAFFGARAALAEGAKHLPGGGLYLGDPEELMETAQLHRDVSSEMWGKDWLPGGLLKRGGVKESKEKGALAKLKKERPLQRKLMDSAQIIELALGLKAVVQGGATLIRKGGHWLKGTDEVAPLVLDYIKDFAGVRGFGQGRSGAVDLKQYNKPAARKAQGFARADEAREAKLGSEDFLKKYWDFRKELQIESNKQMEAWEAAGRPDRHDLGPWAGPVGYGEGQRLPTESQLRGMGPWGEKVNALTRMDYLNRSGKLKKLQQLPPMERSLDADYQFVMDAMIKHGGVMDEPMPRRLMAPGKTVGKAAGQKPVNYVGKTLEELKTLRAQAGAQFEGKKVTPETTLAHQEAKKIDEFIKIKEKIEKHKNLFGTGETTVPGGSRQSNIRSLQQQFNDIMREKGVFGEVTPDVSKRLSDLQKKMAQERFRGGGKKVRMSGIGVPKGAIVPEENVPGMVDDWVKSLDQPVLREMEDIGLGQAKYFDVKDIYKNLNLSPDEFNTMFQATQKDPLRPGVGSIDAMKASELIEFMEKNKHLKWNKDMPEGFQQTLPWDLLDVKKLLPYRRAGGELSFDPRMISKYAEPKTGALHSQMELFPSDLRGVQAGIAHEGGHMMDVKLLAQARQIYPLRQQLHAGGMPGHSMDDMVRELGGVFTPDEIHRIFGPRQTKAGVFHAGRGEPKFLSEVAAVAEGPFDPKAAYREFNKWRVFPGETGEYKSPRGFWGQNPSDAFHEALFSSNTKMDEFMWMLEDAFESSRESAALGGDEWRLLGKGRQDLIKPGIVGPVGRYDIFGEPGSMETKMKNLMHGWGQYKEGPISAPLSSALDPYVPHASRGKPGILDPSNMLDMYHTVEEFQKHVKYLFGAPENVADLGMLGQKKQAKAIAENQNILRILDNAIRDMGRGVPPNQIPNPNARLVPGMAAGGLVSYFQRGGREGEFYGSRQSQIRRARKTQTSRERGEQARKLREENQRLLKQFHPLAQQWSGTISQGDQNLLDKGWKKNPKTGNWLPPGAAPRQGGGAQAAQIKRAGQPPKPAARRVDPLINPALLGGAPNAVPFGGMGDDDPKVPEPGTRAYKAWLTGAARKWRLYWKKGAKGPPPQRPPGLERGGGVDSIPAMLTPGEFVMNRGAVQRHGTAFMSKLNEGQLPGFNQGGPVYAESGIHVQARAGGDYAGPDMAAEFAKVGAALSQDLSAIFGTMEFHHKVTVDGQLNIGGINSEVVATAIRDALANYIVGEVKKGLENAKKYFRSGE